MVPCATNYPLTFQPQQVMLISGVPSAAGKPTVLVATEHGESKKFDFV